MIRGYSDHAANERTFLAWVRTGIAVIAFGFVVEKFNLFMAEVAATALGAGTALGEAASRLQLQNLSGPFGHYDGLALIFGGVGIVVLSTIRFLRTTKQLDDPAEYSAKSARAELVLAAWLVLLVASYSVYLAVAPHLPPAAPQ
jgi:putative membrane protein